ncbi:hypothetical protein TcarDRAFT_2633 [Thermosinus carboxydivorans Nor1]|uniref:GrpE protein n=1 Tax=Thermosinus carboxydivorans Nor1 TaxID=401526 RepID=A1HM98_9FIRM|nr:nucleotide exchange factor GrpE [Thermosinus carboxydivorans]EAX48944.1 hypothetical protein TcarDRAFT_2633 [Thermosinus carboxydivorans Nor1]
MGLFFWRKNKDDVQYEQLAGQLAAIQYALTNLSEQLSADADKRQDISDQLAKLARLQYKSSQEITGRLADVDQRLAALAAAQAETVVREETVQSLVWQRQYLVDILLQQLDELDRACAGLNGEAAAAWRDLLAAWAERLVAALAAVGLYELNVTGQTFDPEVAIAVGSIRRQQPTQNAVPYEVAEVVRRGFCDGAGQVVRKAEVITYQEGERAHD